MCIINCEYAPSVLLVRFASWGPSWVCWRLVEHRVVIVFLFLSVILSDQFCDYWLFWSGGRCWCKCVTTSSKCAMSFRPKPIEVSLVHGKNNDHKRVWACCNWLPALNKVLIVKQTDTNSLVPELVEVDFKVGWKHKVLTRKHNGVMVNESLVHRENGLW